MRLRALGHDEYWLQDQLAANPALLGLGDLEVVAQELHQTSGGYLDLLLTDGDTYYSVELQLDGLDASHGFRVLEYWTRNKARWPDQKHVAVVGAEQINTRYGTALSRLADDLPIIAVEFTAEPSEDDVQLTSKIVIAHDGLGLDTEPMTGVVEERSARDWKEAATHPAQQALEEFERFVDDRLGAGAYLDYSLASHIGVRRGRRVWAQVRLVENGLSINVPDPDWRRVVGDATDAFRTMRDETKEAGVSMRWQPWSGNGSRPINLRLRPGDLDEPQVDWALHACWDAFYDLEPFAARYGSSDGRSESLWHGNEATGYVPYYAIDYVEAGYGQVAHLTRVDFFGSQDEWTTLFTVPDEDWDDMEFARRVLLHLTDVEPTKKAQRRFLAGPAGGWEPGDPWDKTQAELSEWVREHGD
jgi:hypothetical protein